MGQGAGNASYGLVGMDGGLLVTVVQALFWILLIAGIYCLIRWFFATADLCKEKNSLSHDSPLEIVRQRYARGEIKRDEYEQLVRDLS